MATYIASSPSSVADPLVLNTGDATNAFFGSSGADYLVYGGKGRLAVWGVTDGDTLQFDNLDAASLQARVRGNTVVIANSSGAELARLGGLAGGERVKVAFADGNFMTLEGDNGTVRLFRGGVSVDLSATYAPINLESPGLTEADISASISGNTITVTIDRNGQTFDRVSVDFSLFAGGTAQRAVQATLAGNAYVASYTFGTLPSVLVAGTAVPLVDTSVTANVDFSDAVSVTVLRDANLSDAIPADAVTVDNIAPVLTESLIETRLSSNTVSVQIPVSDYLANPVAGVTVDFSLFGGSAGEVTATRSGDWFVASSPYTGSGVDAAVIVTARDDAGNSSVFMDAPVNVYTPNSGTAVDSSDASTAMALDDLYMIVGDDEANVLRVYPRNGGAAVAEWSYDSNVTAGSELDLEASTRIGTTGYFIGSHSNKSNGAEENNREYLFSVTVSGTGAQTQFSFTSANKRSDLETRLKTWDSGNSHGKGANYFGFTTASADNVPPEAVNGFSIEGMTASQDGQSLLLGFRAPQSSTTTRDKAVVVPVTIDANLFSGVPTFGTPIELNLGGRGIRSLEKAADGSGYLILAGPAGSASSQVTHDFRLYRWDGSSTPPTELDVDLDSLLSSTGGSFESLVEVPSTAQGTWIPLLQDNGDTLWPGQTSVSKDLAAAQQQFLGNWINLGANVTDTTAPVLKTVAADLSGQPIGSNIVLRFDEAVVTQVGTGLGTGLELRQGSASGTLVTASVSTAYNGLIIDPASALSANTTYVITAPSTLIEDTRGNDWAGLTSLSFVTASNPPYTLLITEVNSNAANGGDFFELYNYGSTPINLTGWKYDDDSAAFGQGAVLPTITLAAGKGAVFVVGDTPNENTFKSAWGITSDNDTNNIFVLSGSPGLGSGDAVVLFDSAGRVMTSFVYKTTAITASDGTVLNPVTRTTGTLASGHAGVAVGGLATHSAIWDGGSTTDPRYQAAAAGTLGASAQASPNQTSIGSPGKIDANTSLSTALVDTALWGEGLDIEAATPLTLTGIITAETINPVLLPG